MPKTLPDYTLTFRTESSPGLAETTRFLVTDFFDTEGVFLESKLHDQLDSMFNKFKSQSKKKAN